MMIGFVDRISPYADLITFVVGLPTVLATYYQSFKARQEARREREGRLHSQDCLEFVSGDGDCINLVPLETLHSLPRAGDVILLPGDGICTSEMILPGAYLVESVEHFYTRIDYKGCRQQEARLTKAVAKVTSLNPVLSV
ncbi:MAG TPA: hypothetical protein VGT08_04490 [Terracidiphilus sp.]|nr:hypothetical protein [Terracidiphilus sp.]